MNEELNDLFVLLIGTIVALNSIAIPVSYSIVSSNLKPLLTTDSHKIFINETTFKTNLLTSFSCIAIYLIPLLIDLYPYSKETHVSVVTSMLQIPFLIFTCLSFLGFLIAFTEFSYRIYEYSSNSEEIMFEASQNVIDQFISELNDNK
jgi:hypothetical protein